MTRQRFVDRVVVVTGAGNGIGREYARASMARRGGGVIVNQSSMAAYLAAGGAYGISKLALHGLTMSLAAELGPVEVSESHRSFPSLNVFRSPDPDRSWVTGAGLVLDLASIYLSTVDVATNPRAALMVRSGFLSLRRVCEFFAIPYDADPSPSDPISITRDEFAIAYDRLDAAGVPVHVDRDRAWADFQGWRVNYDGPLTRLADFTMAPYQPWVSDRSVRFRPTMRHSLRTRRGKAAR